MRIARRDFFNVALFGGFYCGVAGYGAKEAEFRKSPVLQPTITNHNDSGQGIIHEGKTLLISITFDADVEQISGSLPVDLLTSGKERLIEPQPLFFYPAGNRRTFRAILSAPLDALDGQQTLLKFAATIGSTTREWGSPYRIERGNYRASSFTVNKNFSSPSPEIVAQMRRDFEVTAQIYRRRNPRQWQEPFQLPVSSSSRHNFGDRRTVNGTKRYRHAGLDFTSPIGTPVRAINSGIVVFSGEQWTPGQTICLDHGGGIFSKYMHLSERLVSEGEAVKRGQVIATTGRSGGQKPGPHLHLDMVINGSHVDPVDFFRTALRLLTLETAG